MKKLILIGGGGHAISCLDVIDSTGEFDVKGILDSSPKFLASRLGYKYLGNDTELKNTLNDGDYVLVAVGQIKSHKMRKELYERSKRDGASFDQIVSPKAYCCHNSSIGEGTIIMHGAIVNSMASVGRNCIVNSMALIEHNCVIGDHCHVSTGVRINGDVSIGEGTFIGSGAIIREGLIIPPHSVIPAGTILLRN